MNGLLEIVAAGLANTVQDRGRTGYRHLGVALSGSLDPLMAACANALVGNESGAACIEIRSLGPELRVARGPVQVALAGPIGASVRRVRGGEQALSAWTTTTLEVGDCLRVGTPAGGTAYLAVSGGVDTPLELGSRATYLRASIGGVSGRAIEVGDRLDCHVVSTEGQLERRQSAWIHPDGPIRVIPGPQADAFESAALSAFFENDWAVTPEMDRMGMRLAGPALGHRSAEAAEIVSDGVTPGCIQVPGNGQPIVLLADCQTVGGYPKIATVISADLPRLAQCRPGDRLRFVAVDTATGRAELIEQNRAYSRWVGAIEPYRPTGRVDESALYSENLISGMVDARV